VADASAAGTIDLGGDLTVRRMGFGAMRITGEGIWGPPKDRETAKGVLRRAIEHGVNFIDTANSYGPYISEELICDALRPYPADLVIGTKAGLLRPGPNRWTPKGDPDYLTSECEGSLRRLGIDQIPLFQLHRPDPNVPLAESLGALVRLKEQGKIRHIGLCNVNEAQIREAQTVTPIVSIQNRYNLVDRDSESIVDLCEQEQMAFLPWAPIRDMPGNKAFDDMVTRLKATPRQVALAWLFGRSPMMLPIPGTGDPTHLDENLAAAELSLSAEDIAALR
jgi:pyridoxine 4-dehydrogenase